MTRWSTVMRALRHCGFVLAVAGCSSPVPPVATSADETTPQASPTPAATAAATASAGEPAATTASAPTPTAAAPTPTAAAPTPSPTVAPFTAAWRDVTAETIGTTADWTNKVELADINGDGLVDILFANGGDYESPGTPVPSRVFANRGGGTFEDVTQDVVGELALLTRVVKVRDLNADGIADIFLGTTFQTQSRLLVGSGDGAFFDVTDSQLPQVPLSIGDVEFGDVDADGDLDIVLADWGPGSPMANEGGLVQLWLNDGRASFTDAAEQMPPTRVGFSWDIEFVDVDNDWDLDLAISCKVCPTSLLFENDGGGTFADVTQGRMPAFPNNYEFAPMDLDGDGFLDLVTINDGPAAAEHVFRNDGRGGFVDMTAEWWPYPHNSGHDDNVVVFLDIDSDGDADFLIGSLDGPDRLLLNDGSGRLTKVTSAFDARPSGGTLGMAVADLNGDGRPDVIEGQGEVAGHEDERVYFATEVLPPDTAPPSVATDLPASAAGHVIVHARVHDSRTPNMPHDWRSVALRWNDADGPAEIQMVWYGENLFRVEAHLPPDAADVRVCAVDAAHNEACG